MKKKWSLRSISFSRKDKQKPSKKEEEKTNGDIEKVAEEVSSIFMFVYLCVCNIVGQFAHLTYEFLPFWILSICMSLTNKYKIEFYTQNGLFIF